MLNGKLKDIIKYYRKVDLLNLETLQRSKIKRVRISHSVVTIELYPCNNIDLILIRRLMKEYSFLQVYIPLKRAYSTTLIVIKESFKRRVILRKEKYFISLIEFKRILEEIRDKNNDFEYYSSKTSISNREIILCWIFCSLLAVRNLFDFLPKRIRRIIKKYKIKLKPSVYFRGNAMLGITAEMEQVFFLDKAIKKAINCIINKEHLLDFLINHVNIHIEEVVRSLFISTKSRFIL